MAISVFGADAVRKYINESFREYEQKLVKVMAYAGELAVNEARSNHRYKDRTGNLTSSIGYVIAKGGNIITKSSFNQVAAVSEHPTGTLGSNKGAAFAEELASRTDNKLTLIIVAGMDYAQVVNDKGYNVTDSAEEIATKAISRLMPRMKK